jgi:hypothetical protein
MHNIEILNKLLKNELSATETYQQAVDKLKEDGIWANQNIYSQFVRLIKMRFPVYSHSSINWEELPVRTQAPGARGQK